MKINPTFKLKFSLITTRTILREDLPFNEDPLPFFSLFLLVEAAAAV